MARISRTTATEGTVVTDTDTPELPAAAEAANLLAAVQADYSDERDLANQLLGQVQMANAFGKWTTVVYLSKLQQVRESKLYRALPARNVVDEHGLEIADCRLNTWDGYCRALGLSANKVEEDLRNLSTFGQEALESMSRMGIGYRELRQYRKLPEDQKAALIEVAKSGDKESFVELAEEIISKHAAEKAELQKKLDDVQGDYDALSKVEADTSKKLRAARLDMEKLQLRTAPWSDKVAPFQEEIAKRQVIIDESMGRHLQAVEALDAWWLGEVANQPDYDPEAQSEMPLEVRTVLVELHDAINRSAHLIAAARHELYTRFGHELTQAQQHLLQLEEEPA